MIQEKDTRGPMKNRSTTNTFFRRSVDFVFLSWVRITFAVIKIWEPGTVPPRRTPSEEVTAQGLCLCAWVIALFIVIMTNSGRTVTTTSPWIEDSPATISSQIYATSGWIHRGRCGVLGETII